jgi:ribosomal protein S18 acetylase RimI-like enzyme
MSSEVLVRQARPGDEHGICRVCEAGFRLVASELLPPEVVDRQVAAFYRPERVAGEVDPTQHSRAWNGYVVAEQTGEIVGAAGGGVDQDGVGHLYVIYLDPSRRGEGIGSRLLEFVSEQQRALGAVRQQVAVLADNQRGLPFYEARGFTEVARRSFPADDPNAVEELVLERGL